MFRFPPPQRGERRAAAAARPEAFAQIAIEDRMRADFEKDIEALGSQRRNCGCKLNRFADIVPPICRVELAPLVKGISTSEIIRRIRQL